MKYYILLSGNTVSEVVPEFDIAFPDIPLRNRYVQAFVDSLIEVPKGSAIPDKNWVFENGVFKAPPLQEERGRMEKE